MTELSETPTIEHQNRIATAVVLGLGLSFNPIRGPNNANFLALFDFGNDLRNLGVLVALKIFIVAGVALGLNRRILFALVALLVTSNFLLMYTGIGAFAISLGMNALLCFFILHETADRRRIAVNLTFALIFILAALQKLNPSYLSGEEFTPRGTFLYFVFQWGLPTDAFSGAWGRILPPISIAIEFIIGIGLLARPRFFAHVACLFVLGLTLINANVLFVYGVFFPLAILLDDKWADRLHSTRMSNVLGHPFFWAFAFTFFLATTTTFFQTFLQIYPLAVALIVYHAMQLKPAILDDKTNLTVTGFKTLIQTPQLSLVPALMIATFVASAIFAAPRPLGFSMFSGPRLALPAHQIAIEDPRICQGIARDWIFTAVIDAGLKSISETSCTLYFPTDSGLIGAKRLLCHHWPRAAWVNASPEPHGESCASNE